MTQISVQQSPRIRSRLVNAAVAVTATAVAVALFAGFDYVYTIVAHKLHKPAYENPLAGHCRAPDPVRHHAFEPGCKTVTAWGAESYELATNSLGLRDETVRQVPLHSGRPRILMLGDSFTEGMCAWRKSYVGKISARFPQYEFLNGGMASYAPSNYLNVTRMLLRKGVEIDEAIVFIDISDAQDEAAYYRDIDDSGAVAGPVRYTSIYPAWRFRIRNNFIITNTLVEFFERTLVKRGSYHLPTWGGNLFDIDRGAWTYRKVSDTAPYNIGYAPLGLEGGIQKERAKMTLLWQELAQHHIPISVVVYPWPSQIVHDTADSRQARIWSDWCNGKCKRFISLFPAFQEVKRKCPADARGCWYLSHFIYGDFHFSEEGSALVADVVSRGLEEMPPAKAGAQAAWRASGQ